MNIEREERNDIVILKLDGELSIFFKEEAEAIIQEELNKNKFKFVFDLTNVSYIDSSGLSLIILVGNASRKKGAKVRLVSPTPQVKYVIDIARIEQIIEFHDSIDDAVSAFE